MPVGYFENLASKIPILRRLPYRLDLLRQEIKDREVEAQRDHMAEALLKVQNDIAAVNPEGYYATTYRAYERGFWEHALRWLPQMQHGIRVLDIGAAYGTLAILSRRLLKAKVTCIDAIDYFYPRPLFERERIKHVVKQIEIDDLRDLGKFDLVIFTEVLEHLNFHPRHTLQKIWEIMRPDGYMILTTPDADTWGRVTQYYPSLDALPAPDPNQPWIDGHIWQYTDPEVFAVLRECGFKVQEFALAPGHGPKHLNILCQRTSLPMLP